MYWNHLLETGSIVTHDFNSQTSYEYFLHSSLTSAVVPLKCVVDALVSVSLKCVTSYPYTVYLQRPWCPWLAFKKNILNEHQTKLNDDDWNCKNMLQRIWWKNVCRSTYVEDAWYSQFNRNPALLLSRLEWKANSHFFLSFL